MGMGALEYQGRSHILSSTRGDHISTDGMTFCMVSTISVLKFPLYDLFGGLKLQFYPFVAYEIAAEIPL